MKVLHQFKLVGQSATSVSVVQCVNKYILQGFQLLTLITAKKKMGLIKKNTSACYNNFLFLYTWYVKLFHLPLTWIWLTQYFNMTFRDVGGSGKCNTINYVLVREVLAQMVKYSAETWERPLQCYASHLWYIIVYVYSYKHHILKDV